MSKPILLSLTAALLWGIWGICAKLAADRIGYWPSVLVYSLVSCAFISTVFAVSGAGLRQLPLAGLMLAAGAGIAGGFAVISFQKALATGELGSSISITALYPILPVLYGIMMLGEKVTITKGAGMGLAVAAGILLSL